MNDDWMEMMKEMDERAEERMAAREEKILQVEREMEEKRREGQQEQERRMQTMFGNIFQKC